MSTPPLADETDPEFVSVRDAADGSAMRLVAAVQALSLARDLDAIIDIVRTAARAIAYADGASFILRDGDECYYVDEDAIAPLWKGQRFPMTACVSGWAMANERAAVIKDIYQDDRVPFNAYRPTFVKSLVMVPIRTENPIGAIGLYWAERHSASDAEVELLQALASSTAVAMENLMLYRGLEKRVEERTRDLEHANHELETFSYSVSHDLQAPLRHIISYSELLTREHPGALDEESRAWLDRIQASAAHMTDLIQALLRLSRYTRLELQPTLVDLSRMAEDEMTLLREESPARGAQVRIETGLEARGDESLLRILVHNLLENAWKFTSKRETAQIEFGATRQADGSPAYFVRDNGAGFEMQYANKLFAPFQRLHAAKDFSGTGIGLATVRRILQRHDGNVWAEAEVGQGATFYFTLNHADPSPRTFAAMRDGAT